MEYPTNSPCFLGVDIGSTKSHALIADATGRATGFGAAGPGNHEVVGYDGLRAALQAITSQALEMAGIPKEALAGAGFGVSGFDWPSELAPTLEAIGTLGLGCPVKAVNDTVVGLIAGAREGWGVAVVAGTGNNCWGRDRQGREGRMTGCGFPFAENGGAGELVMRARQAVSLAWSRRGPHTRLTEAFIQQVGARNLDDFLEGLALEWYDLDASAAPLVFRIAQEGDAVAKEVVAWAGRELGSLAIGVIRQLGLEEQDFDVVQVGSLWNGGALLSEPFCQTVQAVAPGAHSIRLMVPPVVGGVLLGMEAAGLRLPEIRARLVESTHFLRRLELR
jgi:N-acetylglucosamine kinase-like BadF-type ATPase